MSPEPVIDAQNLGKCYRMYASPADRLKQMLWGRLTKKGYGRDFWALKDFTLTVEAGDVVGVIGRNGSGKSTLLQILSGVLTPTRGLCRVRGRTTALLELGSGFNGDFTGRDNVRMSATVMGLDPHEIELRMAEVEDFADIGEFFDQPVSTYSSGMTVRLAFAVNALLDPEILIIDEALSVGDAPFQAKCFSLLRDLIGKGVSILLVSHDIATVRSLCTRAVWLENGRMQTSGEAKAVCKAYERFCWLKQGVKFIPKTGERIASTAIDLADATKADENTKRPTAEDSPEEVDVTRPLSPELTTLLADPSRFLRDSNSTSEGTGGVRIRNVVITDIDAVPLLRAEYNQVITVYSVLELMEAIDSEFILALALKNLKGETVLSAHDLYGSHRLTGRRGARFAVSAELALPLHHETYALAVGVSGFLDGEANGRHGYDFSRAIIWDMVDQAAFVEVLPFSRMPLGGPVHVNSGIEIRKLPDAIR